MHDFTCGITVTYHPDASNLANLGFVRAQVDCSVVVDNGSNEAELALLRPLCDKLGTHLVENGRNLGIAAALNCGIRWAKALGCTYVVLFDQDSKPLPSFVEKSLTVFSSRSNDEKIAIAAPCLLDARSLRSLSAVRYGLGEPIAAQTSGSVMPIQVFDDVGWFDEAFFIDCVDFDYCLRLRNHGWSIKECKEAVLLHQPANYQAHRFLGLKSITASNYTARRRYYRTRNILWMLRRHGGKYLRFCLALNYVNVKDLAKIAWEEERLSKWSAAVRGYIDGICAMPPELDHHLLK